VYPVCVIAARGLRGFAGAVGGAGVGACVALEGMACPAAKYVFASAVSDRDDTFPSSVCSLASIIADGMAPPVVTTEGKCSRKKLSTFRSWAVGRSQYLIFGS